MAKEMETWFVEVFGAFPDAETIQPMEFEEFQELSDEAKKEFLDTLDEEASDWLFDRDTTGKITPAEAVDYYMTEIAGFQSSKWATYRERGTESIRKNRRQAEGKLISLRQHTGLDYLADDDGE